MIFARLFSRKWWVTRLLVIAAIGVMIRLGIWQLDRLEQRKAFNQRVLTQQSQPTLDLNKDNYAEIDLPDMEYRQVIVSDEYDPAISIHGEDIENNRMLSLYGAELIDDGDVILTHCNAGALATGGYGTALGVIRAAHESGKRIKVLATETRPYMQGARLTVWELSREGIPVELIPDNHVGILSANRGFNKVIVGADRIALNGDTANKVGTYMVALCAHAYQIPFYIAAPVSTFDRHIESGVSIPIEERDGKEVKYLQGKFPQPENPSRCPRQLKRPRVDGWKVEG